MTEFTVRIAGIGGTGVVTAAQILAYAAHMAGRHVRTLDQTGLAQKAGPVVSDLRVSTAPINRPSKLAATECDLYLASDLLVGADPKHLAVADPARTVAVMSSGLMPTGSMVADPTAVPPEVANLIARIESVSRSGVGATIDARAVSHAGFGSDQYANIVLLGAAYQTGALPIPLTALEEAMRLSGVAVEQNLQAFALGRRAILDPVDADAEIAPGTPQEEFERLLRDRSSDLVAYQNVAYADSYVRLVHKVREAEAEHVPGQYELSTAVARNLYKLMAYKDEYEVARLSLDPVLRSQIVAQFGTDAKYVFKLHPPLLRALGLRRKIALGRSATPLFIALRAGRRLRGTRLDPFAFSQVRQAERRLGVEYSQVAEELCVGLGPGNHATAMKIAELPDLIRGYEQIKLATIAGYDERLRVLRAEFASSEPACATRAVSNLRS